MAYEYKDILLDYASDSKTYEEYKAISQELQEVYRKAKTWEELKVELKRKHDMESERLRRANKNLEDNDSKEYIIGKITGQKVALMNIMTTISELERADYER